MNHGWLFKLNPLGLASADPYIIKRMLDDNQVLRDSFFIDLCSLIKDYSKVLNLSYIGFPASCKSVFSL